MAQVTVTLRDMRHLLRIAAVLGSALVFLVVVVLLVGCTQEASAQEVVVTLPEDAPAAPVVVLTPPLAMEAATSLPRPRRAVEDPYAGWQTWCESPALLPCNETSDCRPDRTGQDTRCARPYWSKEERFCIVEEGRKAARRTRAWQTQRIADIVDEVCWGLCDDVALKAVLTMVAMRESTMRMWKLHRLDEKPNASAWHRRRATFVSNRHHKDAERWQGWGLYGQQAALFVDALDPSAPPEILCRDVEATIAWLERARTVYRKQRSMGITPTWATIEGALSTGKLRVDPQGRDKVRRALAKVGRDADAAIRSTSLWMERDPATGMPIRTDEALRDAVVSVRAGLVMREVGRAQALLGP